MSRLRTRALRTANASWEHIRAAARFHSSLRQLRLRARTWGRSLDWDTITPQDWEAERASRRHELSWALGIDGRPVPEDLQAEVTGTLERSDYLIHKIVFQSLPGLYVTANFYEPRERPVPSPCILYLNGHWPSLDGAKTGFQDRFLWYPAHGFATLVVDPLGFGEIPGVHHGTSRSNRWEWLSLGYTPAGVEVWNAMRALDWLATQPGIDISRCGATGISGGGVITQYLAALDERVAVAAPSCSSWSVASQVEHSVVHEQCDCTYFPSVHGLDFADVVALIAPRPLLILGGRKDPIFPPDGYRHVYRRVSEVYKLYRRDQDDKARIRLVESSAGHTDTPRQLRETRRWMTAWIGNHPQNGTKGFTDGNPPTTPPSDLRCLVNAPPNPANLSIHDSWTEGSNPVRPGYSDNLRTRGSHVQHILRHRVFAWFPDRSIPVPCRRLRGSGGYTGAMADFSKYEIETEPGCRILVENLEPRADPADLTPVLIRIRRPEDHVGYPDIDDLLPLIGSVRIVLVTPRFADNPLSGRCFAQVERTAALLGRTIAAMQIWDVLRVVDWIRSGIEIPSNPPIVLSGRGDAATIALYAAALDEGVAGVVLEDLPPSHRAGPALLTVLRDTDLPGVAGLVSGRNLTFVNDAPRGDEWTVAAKHTTGSPIRFSVSDSVCEGFRRQVLGPKISRSEGAQ
jgi:poly(3-hydroxybutyrate) depolymerase